MSSREFWLSLSCLSVVAVAYSFVRQNSLNSNNSTEVTLAQQSLVENASLIREKKEKKSVREAIASFTFPTIDFSEKYNKVLLSASLVLCVACLAVPLSANETLWSFLQVTAVTSVVSLIFFLVFDRHWKTGVNVKRVLVDKLAAGSDKALKKEKKQRSVMKTKTNPEEVMNSGNWRLQPKIIV